MKESLKKNCLIIGIGNSGRQDDGLGWAFLDKIKPLVDDNYTLEYRYQLQIEDAELLTQFSSVFFVDASKNNLQNGFKIEICKPSQSYSFSTHALKPETILYLTENLYQHQPKAFILAIQGYEWELKIGLTAKTLQNLNKALIHFSELELNNWNIVL